VGQVKTGSVSRTVCTARYNKSLLIEEELDASAVYLGLEALNYNDQFHSSSGLDAHSRLYSRKRDLRWNDLWVLGERPFSGTVWSSWQRNTKH
jgi:hypothetical protein